MKQGILNARAVQLFEVNSSWVTEYFLAFINSWKNFSTTCISQQKIKAKANILPLDFLSLILPVNICQVWANFVYVSYGKDRKILACAYSATYSSVPNKRTGPNKPTGWNFDKNQISVQGGILIKILEYRVKTGNFIETSSLPIPGTSNSRIS